MIEFLTQPAPQWAVIAGYISGIATALFYLILFLNWTFDEQNPVN